jgi:hypothetical protein
MYTVYNGIHAGMGNTDTCHEKIGLGRLPSKIIAAKSGLCLPNLFQVLRQPSLLTPRVLSWLLAGLAADWLANCQQIQKNILEGSRTTCLVGHK